MVKINGIHHVAIKANGVDKFNETIRFYNEILGLPIIRRWEKGGALCAMLDTGAGILELFSNAECEPQLGPLRHIAFSVESVDDCIEAVRAAGYEITVEPKDVDIPSDPVYPIRVGFCIGAAGEEVEFFTAK
ncbi:MAG: VOC family protein [Clostridia bacterium]|nr:VOC family protein [Clostridia bacterium]MBQ9920045.1 VOC family protein [Clostridia bacterium]